MKISKQAAKKPVKSCDVITPDVPVAPDTQVVGQFSDMAPEMGPYDQAKCFIQSAISALTCVASTDPIAKDSIANLAVVLFDLQGSL